MEFIKNTVVFVLILLFCIGRYLELTGYMFELKARRDVDFYDKLRTSGSVMTVSIYLSLIFSFQIVTHYIFKYYNHNPYSQEEYGNTKAIVFFIVAAYTLVPDFVYDQHWWSFHEISCYV